jgi:hypothetical protein
LIAFTREKKYWLFLIQRERERKMILMSDGSLHGTITCGELSTSTDGYTIAKRIKTVKIPLSLNLQTG